MAAGGSKTQSTNTQPWSGAIPNLNLASFQATNEFVNGMPKQFQGSTVANMNPTQMAGIQGLQQGSQQANSTLQDLMGGGPNPYLGDLFKQGSRDIENNVNFQFSRAGRYGSGAQTDVLSRNMGDLWTNLAGAAYENDQNRRLSAVDRIGSVNKDIIGAGQMLQDQQQRELDDQIQKWNYDQNANRANIEWLNSIASGQGGLGSTQTGPNPNYRSATDNLFGLASSLGSAWLMSDRRLKADIEPLGADEFGLNWYRYRYVWDEPGTERVGVMADEAPSHAVDAHEYSFAAVNYGAL